MPRLQGASEINELGKLMISYQLSRIPLTFLVWMVAPVVMLMSCPGTSWNSNSFTKAARAQMASSIANWSPTHLRGPPLKGMYLRAECEGRERADSRALGE